MIVLVLSCLLLGVIAQEKDIYNIPQSEMPIVIETSLKCMPETGANADNLHDIILWKVKETQVIKDFLYCMMHKVNYADDNGHLVKSRTMELISDYPKKDEVGLVIDQCNTVQGTDSKDTLFKAVSCFHSKSPMIFALNN